MVLDAGKQERVSFVNIGIKRKNTGTVSAVNGTFSLQISQQQENDTLTFSMVGYYELNVPITSLLNKAPGTFRLKTKIKELEAVNVTAQKYREQRFGLKNNSLINFGDGSMNQNDIFEIAQLIHTGKAKSKITSVNLFIVNTVTDSVTFRVNFYSLYNKKPGARLVEKNILKTCLVKEGWLSVNLAEHNIYLSGDFVAGIEFIPRTKNKPVYYGIKLGGASKSFMRTSSQGDWTMPPHHYRLYVTALVAEMPQGLPDEEKETPPTARFFSKIVNDSFSVFVALPEGHGRKKEQPLSVVYVLDANMYFDPLAAFLKEKGMRDKILVGIGYKHAAEMDSLRQRDYTFPEEGRGSGFSISGGGDKFYDFIGQELIPYIDHTYGTATADRCLMGHSLGAYFTLYALYRDLAENRQTFNYYTAPSPSLEYKQAWLNRQFKNMRRPADTSSRQVFVSYEGRKDEEDAALNGLEQYNDFIQILSGEAFRQVRFEHRFYPDFGHMETALPAFFKALAEIK